MLPGVMRRTREKNSLKMNLDDGGWGEGIRPKKYRREKNVGLCLKAQVKELVLKKRKFKSKLW